jgi:hypothetical protein
MQVWVSIVRRGNPYHRIVDEFTACARSVEYHGELLDDEQARQAGMVPCPRCWPERQAA